MSMCLSPQGVENLFHPCIFGVIFPFICKNKAVISKRHVLNWLSAKSSLKVHSVHIDSISLHLVCLNNSVSLFVWFRWCCNPLFQYDSYFDHLILLLRCRSDDWKYWLSHLRFKLVLPLTDFFCSSDLSRTQLCFSLFLV